MLYFLSSILVKTNPFAGRCVLTFYNAIQYVNSVLGLRGVGMQYRPAKMCEVWADSIISCCLYSIENVMV